MKEITIAMEREMDEVSALVTNKTTVFKKRTIYFINYIYIYVHMCVCVCVCVCVCEQLHYEPDAYVVIQK